MHSLISDAFLITNDSSKKEMGPGNKPKEFLYEFAEASHFKSDDLDLILCTRLAKQKDENKFAYLYESYERVRVHIVSKRK